MATSRKPAKRPTSAPTAAKGKASEKQPERKQYVEVRVSGCALRGRRVCPFAVLLRAGGTSGAWVELARTEVVYHDPDPGFVAPFQVPRDQTMYRMALYSRTGQSEDVNRCSFLGYGEFTVDRMLSKDDGVIERVLRNRRGRTEPKRGRLILCGELVDVPVVPHTFSIRFGFGPNSKVWGPMNGIRKQPRKAFYVIYRAIVNGVADEDWVPVYRSEIRDAYAAQQVAVMFDGASLSAEGLYANDENRGLRFEVFHYNPSGPHIPLGFVQTSASAFKYAKPGGKLFMVAVPGSRLLRGTVYLDMAKTGLSTRRGGVSSVFCLRAGNFVWGEQEEDEVDDYLERDVDGRKRVEWVNGEPPQGLPMGISYMSSRRTRIGFDSDADSTDE